MLLTFTTRASLKKDKLTVLNGRSFADATKPGLEALV